VQFNFIEKFRSFNDYFKSDSIFSERFESLKSDLFNSNNVNFSLKFDRVCKSLDMFVSNFQPITYNIRHDSKLYLYRAEDCRFSFISNKHNDMFMMYVKLSDIKNFLGSDIDSCYDKFFENYNSELNSTAMYSYIMNFRKVSNGDPINRSIMYMNFLEIKFNNYIKINNYKSNFFLGTNVKSGTKKVDFKDTLNVLKVFKFFFNTVLNVFILSNYSNDNSVTIVKFLICVIVKNI
jgi:hypothetical protein